jgi:hypothetical protein
MENGDGFEVIRTVPAASLPYGKPGTTYTLVHLPDDPTRGKFSPFRYCSFVELNKLCSSGKFSLEALTPQNLCLKALPFNRLVFTPTNGRESHSCVLRN